MCTPTPLLSNKSSPKKKKLKEFLKITATLSLLEKGENNDVKGKEVVRVSEV